MVRDRRRNPEALENTGFRIGFGMNINEETSLHALEKIMARAAGQQAVHTGEIVNCTVDLAGINDLYLQTLRSFYEMGGGKVHDPGKVMMFLDHYAPASTIAQQEGTS